MIITGSIGIRALSYYVPAQRKSLEDLKREKKLTSSVATLRSFGFNEIRVVRDETHIDLAKKAIGNLLTDNRIDPLEIDLILFAGATTPSLMVYGKKHQPESSLLTITNAMDFFKYPASRIQYELGFSQATVIGIGQQGCSSIFSAWRLARDVLLSEENIRNVLCVSSDVFPTHAPREIIYNVLSDGAGAVVLSKNCQENRVVAISQITKGYYWDGEARRHELIAAYFPTARTIILETIKKAKLTIDDIALLIPHNVSMRSWNILLQLLNFPKARFFGQNIAKIGHSIGADNIINLKDALDQKLVKKGEYVLLFNFGFGVNWSSIIIQH